MRPKSTHQEEKSKPKQIKKNLTTKTTAADQLNPDRKVELPDQSPGDNSRGLDINDLVSSYINRAKLRIRTMSMAGGGKAKEKKEPESTNHFADYISRTKKKLQSTLSMGGGKNTPPTPDMRKN